MTALANAVVVSYETKSGWAASADPDSDPGDTVTVSYAELKAISG